MPTEHELINRYGKEMWKKMVNSGWLDGVTARIASALVFLDCPNCDYQINTRINGDELGKDKFCPKCKSKLIVVKTLDHVMDYYECDIEKAYRSANGDEPGYWEWD